MNRDRIEKLRALASGNIKALASFLYPRGSHQGDYWRVGDIAGRPGGSFGIFLSGPLAGYGVEYNTNKRYDIFAMWMAVRQVDFPTAIDEIEKWLSDGATDQCHVQTSSRTSVETQPQVTPIPTDVAVGYGEGCSFLAENPAWMKWLACWRCWDVAFVGMLGRIRWCSIPLASKGRFVAFPVFAPSATGAPIWIGYHGRYPPTVRDSWFYRPCRQIDGASVPPAPFVLGDIYSSSRILICEGQWDALSIAHALGWWCAESLLPPSGIAIVAIRGVASWRHLIRLYASRWSRRSAVLLLPQNDVAGGKWCERSAGESFVEHLEAMSARVDVLSIRGHKDWNDALRTNDEDQFRKLHAAIQWT